MTYTFEPKFKHAKTYGNNLHISKKHAEILCAAIRKKPLKRAKRLLEDIESKRRSLDGKYYSKATGSILGLIKSCEKNADFLGLDKGKLFVHVSAHQGTVMRRRRRVGLGSRMKSTNIEVMLIERGKIKSIQKPIKKPVAIVEDKNKEKTAEVMAEAAVTTK
ncbi:MAG: uL22 family ribosomal protein [Candidatus Aenigmatarchaeota archaeon]